MNNFSHCTVNLRLFLCLSFVLVVISYLPFSSPSTVSAASSIFGYYFGSNIPGQPQPAKSPPPFNATSILRPSNSTSNLATPPPSNSTSNLAAPPPPSNSTSNVAAPPPPSNSTSNVAAPPPPSNLAAPPPSNSTV